ncbi:MAG: MATE family efflux transporter [Clostridia bacterium]
MRKQIDILSDNIKPGKIIWYLAWPAVLEQLLITFVQFVDTAMVGALGENATASVAVSTSTTWLVNGIFAALGVGFSVLVGKGIGAKDYDYAKRVVRQSIIGILGFGLLIMLIIEIVAPHLPAWMGADPAIYKDATAYLSIVAYAYVFSLALAVASATLRCAGDTRTPLLFNIATNVINIILNYLFILPQHEVSIFEKTITIWGANMGVSGAALATAISITFSGIMLVLILFIKKYPAQISIRDKIRFDKRIWKDVTKLGIPVALERITLSTGQLVMTAMVTGLGTTALASHHLAITAEGLTYMPAFGISAAATTLVAQSLGANRPDKALNFGRLCNIAGVIFMSAMGVVLFLFAEPLISIFTPSREVIELGAKVLKLEAFAQPFFALAMVASGALRGAGDTKWPFYISVIGMWCVRLGIAYVFAYPLGMGLFGAWIGMVSDVVSRGVLTLLRFRSKKWLTCASFSGSKPLK